MFVFHENCFSVPYKSSFLQFFFSSFYVTNKIVVIAICFYVCQHWLTTLGLYIYPHIILKWCSRDGWHWICVLNVLIILNVLWKWWILFCWSVLKIKRRKQIRRLFVCAYGWEKKMQKSFAKFDISHMKIIVGCLDSDICALHYTLQFKAIWHWVRVIVRSSFIKFFLFKFIEKPHGGRYITQGDKIVQSSK